MCNTTKWVYCVIVYLATTKNCLIISDKMAIEKTGIQDCKSSVNIICGVHEYFSLF